MTALEILLARVVDYAGLFPPAALDLAAAVRQFGEHRASAERWMLGRLVVPAARLGDLAEAMTTEVPNGSAAWRLAVLATAPLDPAGGLGIAWGIDLARITAFRVACDAPVNALELRGGDADALALARRAAADAGVAPAATFVEVPWGADHDALARAAHAHGVSLKLRTGGVTADAFPDADVVVRFVAACVARGVSFKLTAGLHHALRGEHALTYEPGCARGTMHGFLNALAATALLADGHDAGAVQPLLEERDVGALAFDDGGLRWRGLGAGLTAVRAARRAFASFGSCSFAEPVAELRALGLLPAAAGAALAATDD
ncbi:hypothetical protein J421_2328 [Gemmatirosa kalamazoonensis]|uniref:Uncharacterized protein n=1 Tax=Gemmatirosa kalamazoonensis TaxID=861299 RepID=W0RHR3_9BACT|nr:hypothetical protein [Gemmatirosa kalamazoonensis]AHG89865.1 hypothetical protein J421_2328 [Gemmatirosa kalamazoonensis]